MHIIKVMNTFEVISLVSKLAKNKDKAIKTFCKNFFDKFPEWDNDQKGKVLTALVESFEKTSKELE